MEERGETAYFKMQPNIQDVNVNVYDGPNTEPLLLDETPENEGGNNEDLRAPIHPEYDYNNFH